MSPRRCAAGVEEGGRAQRAWAAPLCPLLLPASEARSHGHVARGSPSPRYVFSALPGVNCLFLGGGFQLAVGWQGCERGVRLCAEGELDSGRSEFGSGKFKIGEQF